MLGGAMGTTQRNYYFQKMIQSQLMVKFSWSINKRQRHNKKGIQKKINSISIDSGRELYLREFVEKCNNLSILLLKIHTISILLF